MKVILMEFLLVLLFFGLALLLLALGKLLGGKHEYHTCNSENEDEDCAACNSIDTEFYLSKDDPGFSNVAQLGNPNRKNRFIDKLDFKPERFK